MTTSSGIAGMTRNTLISRLDTSSKSPPRYAAVIPMIAANVVARAPASAPRRSERRAPITTWEKMSLPWSVVPNRWFHDGAWWAANRSKSVGCATEIQGAIRAMMITKPTIASPICDFLLPSRRSIHPGSRIRP
jgi:hypothetical protein